MQIDNEFMGKPVNTPIPYGSADHRVYWNGACTSYNNPIEVKKDRIRTQLQHPKPRQDNETMLLCVWFSGKSNRK